MHVVGRGRRGRRDRVIACVNQSASTSNGPETTAPLGISMATATPRSSGVTIQLSPTKRHAAVFSVRILDPIELQEYQLEHSAYIVIRPGNRVVHLMVHDLGRHVLPTLEKDFNIEGHDVRPSSRSCASSASGSHTGSLHVKSAQT